MSSAEVAPITLKPMYCTEQLPAQKEKPEEELYKTVVPNDNTKGLILERASKEVAKKDNAAQAPVIVQNSYMDVSDLVPPNFGFGELTQSPLYGLTADVNNMYNKLIVGMYSNNGQPANKSQYGIDADMSNIQIARQVLTEQLKNKEITLEKFLEESSKLAKKETEERKKYLAEQQSEAQTQEEAAMNKGWTGPQLDAINGFLSSRDNKTFSRESFSADPNRPGVLTATEKFEQTGRIRTLEALRDGTTGEIQENTKLKGFWGGIKRLFSGDKVYTAVINRPDGSKETIKNNDREDFYNEYYKKLGIFK